MEKLQRVLSPFRKRCLICLLALGVSLSAVESRLLLAAAQPNRAATVDLKVQRRPGQINVVLAGLGLQARAVSQRSRPDQWTAVLTGVAADVVPRVPQQVVLESSELLSIRLEPQGSDLRLTVKARFGKTVSSPQISSNGKDLILSFTDLERPRRQSYGQLDLSSPGRVPQLVAVPPMRPRAVAPPLGDMAVGTMVIKNRSFVQASGPPVTLTLNNAPAKDALMSLARIGGYGFVYVGSRQTLAGENQSQSGPDELNDNSAQKISMSFRNEPYERALNGILLASGLQAKLDGRMLLVGPSVMSKALEPRVSKVIRLNQVSAGSAAEYLGNLGAIFNRTNTKTITTGEPSASGSTRLNPELSQINSTSKTSESFGASAGPLQGLLVTTDERLQTVTVVGDSQLVAVAEGYLRQIDLRQRQVALNIRILDISLNNDSQINNSFAFRSGNAFIVSDQGQLLANFGSFKPPGSAQGGLPGQYSAQEGTTPLSGTGSLREEQGFLDRPQAPYPFPGSETFPGGPYRPGFGTNQNPLQPGVSEIDEEGKITYEPPTRFQYPDNQLFDFLVAQIQSSSTKVLASPTLIIQEGGEEARGDDSSPVSTNGKVGRERTNESLVSVGTQLVTSYDVRQDVNGNNFCKPVFSNAGLTFGARVDRIDDNGFVTFSLSPEISAAVGSPETVGNCGSISIINSRSLDTGSIRVRDGQTLILTGVISDRDIEVVTKWPVLGDIPLIGQFFRSSGSDRTKNELVILVTPRIVSDDQGGGYGYGYQPGLPAARQVVGGF